MIFSTLYTELGDRLGAYDPAVSTDLIKLKRWINMGQQYICGKRLWPFMLAEEIVQTVTDITTGTVTISAGSSTITFSSAPSVSVADRYINVSSSNDWYKITSHTAATTTATISPSYVGTSNLTAGTYTIRKLLYSTTTPLVQVLDMKQLVSPVQMLPLSPLGNDFFSPLYTDSGVPYGYIMSSPTSTGALQFSLFQSPSSVMNLMVRGVKNLTDLSSDSDIPLIPIPWQDAILNIAAYYGFTSLDDTRAETELSIGEKRIMDMKTNYSHDPGRHRIMRPVVDQYDAVLQWALPSNFGPEIS